MKRYLLFAFQQWHPDGGLSDVIKEFDEVEEFEEQRMELEVDSYDSWYLWDRITGNEIKGSG